MNNKFTYSTIDMVKTGKKIKRIVAEKGYTVKMIQEYLQLSCAQPIYRWYKGIILPSVDHLLNLSILLDVHMEDLLVKKNEGVAEVLIDRVEWQAVQERIREYYKYFGEFIA